ncbi:MAG: 2-dehydropantoate 2-reductase [Hyphomicrobiales bacterium]|nr:2-dehydropantoate 2-reductase [Hyphomicrobiales bacterium]
MKICIVGAGAIGGLLAVKLAARGHDVSVVARGAQLAAIRASGLTLQEAGTETRAKVHASADMAAIGAQDLVVLGVKAHQLTALVADLPQLFGADTMVLTAQNGIPWWYFCKFGGPLQGRHLESVDPGGRIAAFLPVERVIGSVVYPAAEVVAPGVIRHIEGNRLSIAEIDNSETPRLVALSETLRDAGFKAPMVSDIRTEIWTKLWGNLSFNPISALTGTTLAGLCRFPLTRALAAAMMAEAQSVGEALGIRFRISIDKRLAGGEAVGEHKTSMLQDVEAGRVLEIDALLGSVIELGRLTATATPHLDAVYALAKLLDARIQGAEAR